MFLTRNNYVSISKVTPKILRLFSAPSGDRDLTQHVEIRDDTFLGGR